MVKYCYRIETNRFVMNINQIANYFQSNGIKIDLEATTGAKYQYIKSEKPLDAKIIKELGLVEIWETEATPEL